MISEKCIMNINSFLKNRKEERHIEAARAPEVRDRDLSRHQVLRDAGLIVSILAHLPLVLL